VDLEVFEAIAVEHGASDSDHAGSNVIDREGSGLCREAHTEGEDHGRDESAVTHVHGGQLKVDDTVKTLKLLGLRAGDAGSAGPSERARPAPHVVRNAVKSRSPVLTPVGLSM
jgi:hypothetical protein